MKFKWVLLGVLFLSCNIAFADGFDENYRVYSGDVDGNGYIDLVIRQAPKIVILHGKIATPIVLLPDVPEFALLQNPNDASFSIENNTSGLDMSSLTETALEVTLGDLNIDGLIDLMIKGIGSIVTGAYDQIVFANAVGIPPSTNRAVDDNFQQFFDEVYGWRLDEYYFERTAITNHWYHYDGDESTGWFLISAINFYYSYDGGKRYLDEDDDPNDPYNVPSYCLDYPYACDYDYWVNAWFVWGTYLENIEIVYEYENFNQDALAITAPLETIMGEGGIYSTFEEAILLADILEKILGVEIFRGVLRNGGFVIDFEIGQSEDERARDRLEAFLWSITVIRSKLQVASCSNQGHLDRIWGTAPIPIAAHFDRNINQTPVPWTLETMLPKKNIGRGAKGSKQGFVFSGETGSHNIGATGNKDYRGFWHDENTYKGWQLIYDDTGNLVTDPVNMGTYDFEKPVTDAHLQRDVTPWLEWGNSSLDTSTINQRVDALYSGWTGLKRVVPLYLKRFYRCTPYQQ